MMPTSTAGSRVASRRPYRCGVLSVVKHAYVPLGVAAHPRCELVVVADDAEQPDWVHERNQQFADSQAIPYVRDVERAIRDFQLDIAVVTSQVDRHVALSLRAVRQGLHVIQDKPLGIARSECDELVAACRRHAVRFLMWNRNCLPALRHARELVTSQVIGRPRAAHVDFYFAKDAGPAKGTRPDSVPPVPWEDYQIGAHVDGSDGGLARTPIGELQNEGIYPLAYLHLLTGASVERVFARTARHFHQINADHGAEDLASVTLEMSGGLVGSLALGRIGRASHPDLGAIKVHLVGDRGALVIDEPRPEAALYYRGQAPGESRHRRLAVENDVLLVEDFLRAIEANRPSLLDAPLSHEIFRVVAAALESARMGAVVPVADGYSDNSGSTPG